LNSQRSRDEAVMIKSDGLNAVVKLARAATWLDWRGRPRRSR
jgi:hypothetical protein